MKNFFKKGEWKLLWPFYSVNFLSMFIFVSLFGVLYFIEIGLTLVQIGLLYTVSSIASIVFEIPTGAVADIYGRKASTLIGYVLTATVPIFIYFTQNFTVLLILYAFWGMSYTFISGADHAWIVDLIKRKKKGKLIDSFFAKEHSFYAVGGVLSGLIGAFLVGIFGLKIIWLGYAFAYILGAIILSFGKENFVKKEQHVKNHFKEFISHNKKSIKYTRKNKNLLNIMSASLFFAMAIYVCMASLVWVPLFKSLGLSDSSFGFIISLTWVAGTFAPFISKYIANKMGSKKKYLICILFLMILFIVLTAFFNSLITIIIIYLLFQSLFDFWSPVNMSLFQSFIPGKMRATITSFRSFMFSLVGAFIPLLVGVSLKVLSPKTLLLIGAIFFIPVIIIYSKIKEK